MAAIVYTAVTDASGLRGTLFQGAKFWLSQKVPQRSRFIEQVKANGGEVTPLEKEADVKIVDHARKQQLPGTALEDLEKYAVGPAVGTIRAVGSVIQPTKSGRTKFTTEDDQQLINWVRDFEQRGGATSGNEIYKQLEARNSRHTWQSWRDRWVKTLKDSPRSAFISQDAPPTPPDDPSAETVRLSNPVEDQMATRKPLTNEDRETLLSVGHDIEGITPDNQEQAWSKWADNHENPEDDSAKDRQNLWERTIRPIFLEQEEQRVKQESIHRGPVEFEAEPRHQLGGQEQASLPDRTAPANEVAKESNSPRSPSFHPESPTRQLRALSQEQELYISAIENGDGANDVKYQPRSPVKRKRTEFESGIEIPSSSPMQAEASIKRLRHDSFPPDILSRPANNSGKIPAKGVTDTYASDKPEAIDVIEISDGDDSESLDEELFCSEASHSLSPELGSSPKKVFTSTDRNVSRTQAAFLDPTPMIEYELAAPEDGWQDDDEVEEDRDEDGQSNEDETYESRHKTTGFELAAPEGGWPDEDEEQSDEDENSAEDEQAEYDRILKEEGGSGVEVEDEDESEHDNRPNVYASESSFDTQERKLAQEMGMRAHSSSTPSSTSTVTSRNPSPTRLQPTTQGILTAQTQEPDFSLAEPEGGWDQVLSSPPVSPTSSKPNFHNSQSHQLDQQIRVSSPVSELEPVSDNHDHADNIDHFISHLITQNHNEDDILLALRCTNMDRDLTEKALAIIQKRPGEIPQDMHGFWTETDDRDLKGNDASRIRALEIKHGKESLEMRWGFLEYYGS
ncbi:MAG: hypothetical protein Q9215_003016 [Flavoplaca cf. flavocitrina]